MSRDLEHLELIPEPNDPRILTAVDPETLHDIPMLLGRGASE